MNKSREEFIEQCIAAANIPPDDEDMRNRTRAYFEGLSNEELEKNFADLIGKTDLDEQKAGLAREREKLRIFKTSGLLNSSANDAELDRQLPGGLLSFETFRSLVSNPSIAGKFTWNGPMFGQVIQAEKQRTAEETQKFNMFVQACKHLAVSGQANISPNEANYSLVRAQISQPTTQAIIQALTNGSVQGFAPNDAGTIAAWSEESEVQERQELCRLIADNYTRDKFGREVKYKELLMARYKPLDTLREEAAEIRRRKVLRNLNPEQLREFIKEGQQKPSAYPILPPIISPFEIKVASTQQLRTWVRMYGWAALNSRLLGLDQDAV